VETRKPCVNMVWAKIATGGALMVMPMVVLVTLLVVVVMMVMVGMGDQTALVAAYSF
jgi:hypothetical protein